MESKEDLLVLKEALYRAGILPGLPKAATRIKESLHGRPVDDIPVAIAHFLDNNPGILEQVMQPPVEQPPVEQPPIQQQQQQRPRARNGSANAPVIHRGKRPKGWIIALYGTPGVGKSTLASLAPSPIFGDIESGLSRIDVASSPCPNWDSVLNLSNWFGGQTEFKTLVLDTADVLEKRLWRYLCHIYKWKSIESPGFGRGYAEALEHWVSFLEGLRGIADTGKNIIMTAHSQLKTCMSPEGDSYDRHSMNLHSKVSEHFFGQMDGVFFCHFESVVRKNNTGQYIASGSGDRMIACSDTLSAQVKNRFGIEGKVPMDGHFFPMLGNERMVAIDGT
jgi:hypothetical protein